MSKDFPYPSRNKRVRCPQCDSSDGFAPAIENPEWGYCFACGYKNYPHTKNLCDNPFQSGKLKLRNGKNLRYERQDCSFVDDKKVADSLSYLREIPLDPNRECTPDEERAAIMEYDGGIARNEAELLSGCNERSATDKELQALYRLTPFAATLVELTRPSILIDWNIGYDSNGATLFWYQNINGRFVNAKRIQYSEDGFHRDKKFAPSFLYKSSEGFGVCIYGEHQLNPGFENYLGRCFHKTTPIVLVESEKTAVIMSHYKPEMIWLASGGSKGLTKSKAKVLKGRKTFILYDHDDAGTEGSKNAAEVLIREHCKPIIINQDDIFEGKPSGYDIADSIIDEFSRKVTAI